MQRHLRIALNINVTVWHKRDEPVPFIFTAVNPCCARTLAASKTSVGLSPPIHPYTLTRSRTFPPKSCQTGTPSFFPLMSHRAMSSPERALWVVHQHKRFRVKYQADHKHRATTIESPPVGGLPYILYVVSLSADEAFSEIFVSSFHCFSVPL